MEWGLFFLSFSSFFHSRSFAMVRFRNYSVFFSCHTLPCVVEGVSCGSGAVYCGAVRCGAVRCCEREGNMRVRSVGWLGVGADMSSRGCNGFSSLKRNSCRRSLFSGLDGKDKRYRGFALL